MGPHPICEPHGNRYPLAPLGYKAVIYEDGDTRGSWASRGVDGWYLGPSMDHYRCDMYYIPETCGYHILGSIKLFPQHCQLPDMSLRLHMWALMDELTDGVNTENETTKGKHLLCMLWDCITNILEPHLPTHTEEQKVAEQRVTEQERVINDSPI